MSSPEKPNKVIRPMDVVIMQHHFSSPVENTLDLTTGTLVQVLRKSPSGWWDGVVYDSLGEMSRGWFPGSYAKSRSSVAVRPKSNRGSYYDKSIQNRRRSFPSILKQSLQNIENLSVSSFNSTTSSRKNSAVSFEVPLEHEKKTKRALSTFSSDSNGTEEHRVFSLDELESYLRNNQHSMPPVWIPVSTSDKCVVFYNDDFKVYCRELPSAEFPEEPQRPLKLPGNEAVRNFPIVSAEVSDRLNLKGRRGSSRSGGGGSDYVSNPSSVRKKSSMLFYNPHLFLDDPTDVQSWAQLKTRVDFFVDITIDSVHKLAKELFQSHLDNVCRLVCIFKHGQRLLLLELQAAGIEKEVFRLMKKMMRYLSRLIVNGYLHLRSCEENGIRRRRSAVSENLQITPVSEFYHLALKDATLIKTLSHSVCDLLSSQSMPEMYPRFIRNAYNGGNWKNPFFAERDHSDRPKILLDHDAHDTLAKKKHEVEKMAGGVVELLSSTNKVPTVSSFQFQDERNVSVMTIVYNALPAAARMMDILEAFDFTIFVLLRRLASGDHELVTEESDEGNLPGRDEGVEFCQASLKIVTPILLEFFEAKQQLYDTFVELLMNVQALTLEDPDVFKGLNDGTPIVYDKEAANTEREVLAEKLRKVLVRTDVEESDLLSRESRVVQSIDMLKSRLNIVLLIVDQLREERHTILTYSTRIMNSGVNLPSLIMVERHNTVSDIFEDDLSVGPLVPGRRDSGNVPWFLDLEDAELELVYDKNDNLTGGTKEGLVAKLTNPDNRDSSFSHALLLTFRSIFTPFEFLKALIDSFSSPAPEGLSYEEYGLWLRHKLHARQRLIVEIMRSLLSVYWNYNYHSEGLMSVWLDFARGVNQEIVDTSSLENDIISVRNKSRHYSKSSVANDYQLPRLSWSDTRPPSAVVPKKKFRLRDLDPLELARQLCLREYDAFSRINQMELLSRCWNHKKHGDIGPSPNVAEFVSQCNKLTHFVSYMVLRKADFRKRAEVIKFFVLVAERCFHLKNYSSMTAVISGLGATTIIRLKKSWSLVPNDTVALFRKMDDLMSIDKNYSEYRDLLRFSTDQPSVPFLGTFLQDLRFLADGNSDFLRQDRTKINFFKRAKISATISDALRFEQISYNFVKVKEIQQFLDAWYKKCPDEVTLYDLSQKLEPRMTAAQTLQKTRSSRNVSKVMSPAGSSTSTLGGSQ